MLKIFISKDTFYDEKELTIMAVLNGGPMSRFSTS